LMAGQFNHDESRGDLLPVDIIADH
jgi:hypothetical protein